MGLFSFLTQEIAIDLGTANTLIIMNDKVVVDEPSIVAKDIQTGNIVAIELESLQERDFDKFKSFVEYLSALKFPSNSVDLTKFNFHLEGATLYLDRPKHAPARFAATITQETNINLDSL